MDAAMNMRITAQDLVRFGVIDGVVAEPVGGAHRDPQAVISAVGNVIAETLIDFDGQSPDQIRRARRVKYLAIGRDLKA
jgi:acetyl-CoA carboxylase carboxyl transferase subunit alpha